MRFQDANFGVAERRSNEFCQALLDAGRFYLQKPDATPDRPERQIIQTAISSLGLHDKTRFAAEEKIIEFALEGNRGPGRD